MKKLLFVLIVITACSSFQTKKTTQPKHTTVKKKKVKKPTNVQLKPAQVLEAKQILPPAIQKKIEEYKKMDKSAQPRKVVEYEYKGQKVYYVSMHCCDIYNELYDSTGKLMGHPDGGMTGKGDKKLPDFNTEKTKERIVWTAPE